MKDMAIPKYDDMFAPLLSLMRDGVPRTKASLIQPLAEHFQLTDDEVLETYEGKNTIIFPSHISWTLSYLKMAGLLEPPGRGQYAISKNGIAFSERSNEEIKDYVKSQEKKRAHERKHNDQTHASIPAKSEGKTPIDPHKREGQTLNDQINDLYLIYKRTKYEEIIDMILSKTPESFERVVVQLLQKMGYGRQLRDAGRTTQLSRDGGIDGEIREDVLGLGKISIQAKRYQRDQSIGRPEVQAFAGALQGNRSTKGVFITTSKFTKDAIDYARSLANVTIVLIDGMQLAEYMYQHGLGVEVRDEFAIKDLDESYWDELADGAPSLPAKA